VPGDAGGTTKWGISQRAYPHLDIATLSKRQAGRLARRDYWNAVRAGELPPEVRWHVFDMAFNAGPQVSGRLLQRAVNLCRQSRGHETYLLEDGIVGPATLGAVAELRPERLARVVKAYRIEHYLAVAETRLPKFIHGWLRRAEGEPNA
jgi:lysozyme family protein